MGFASLSIVIPAYNESAQIAATLADRIESWRREQEYEVEVIVVDDGSSDDTGRLDAAADAGRARLRGR